jgi:molybdopterin/thiamine biosynthesis adenylyltransferase
MNSKQSIQSYGRFKGATWFDKISTSTIFVGGCGSIGSWTSFFLARTGANVIVLDYDFYEDHNSSSQLFLREDIAKTKVDAFSSMVSKMCGENNVTPINEQITEEEGQWRSLVSRCEAVVVGFDNLKARRLVYEEWKVNGRDKSIFIDGRLSMEEGTVYVLTKDSLEDELLAYEATYFSDHERVELPCTYKATTHCGALIASYIVANITNWFNNLTEGTLPRPITNIEFHIPLMMFDQPILKAKTYAVTD